jgi:threonyl-tRNA synthetase
MLQRIYGVAFESEELLKEHLHKLDEASRRDHGSWGGNSTFSAFTMRWERDWFTGIPRGL